MDFSSLIPSATDVAAAAVAIITATALILPLRLASRGSNMAARKVGS